MTISWTNLGFSIEGQSSRPQMHKEGAFITVSDCLVKFMYSVSCDYVSTQEFGSIVSNTIDTERTQSLHELELLL